MDVNSSAKINILEDVQYKKLLSGIKQRAYEIIGMGSGRTVFDLGDGTVRSWQEIYAELYKMKRSVIFIESQLLIIRICLQKYWVFLKNSIY